LLDQPGDVVTYALNPLPDALGPRFGKDFPKVQKELREGEASLTEERARALMGGKTVEVAYDGKREEVGPDEVEVRQQPAEGYAIASDANYLAALKTELTEELLLEGLAREVVRRVQMLRREADFNIDDRIHVTYQADERLAAAIEAQHPYVMAETLADRFEEGEAAQGARGGAYEIEGERLVLGVKRV
jgi:isoleucyl-tRNA synthetase